VLPSERRRVRQQRIRHGPALVSQVLDGVGQIGRVPVHDGGDHQVQPGRAELLRLLAAVGDAALLERADDLGQRVPLLALVQAGLAALAQAGDSSQSNMNKVRSATLLHPLLTLVSEAGGLCRISGS
jgi:hypothetical protein